MRNTKKAFTLVELIVVITILAILATIAFISLQGYSQDAKNSKVQSDLRTMVTAIETGVTKGNFTLDWIIGTTSSANTYTGTGTITYATGTTTATVALTGATTYEVGDLDFTVIGQNGDEFKDYDGNWYLAAIAAYGSTSYYQLAGQTKNSAGDYTAVVRGNYVARTTSSDVTGLISASGSTTSTVVNGDTLTGANGLY